MSNKHYVYLYIDPSKNEPIYVGVGCGVRWSKHLTRKDKHPFTHRLNSMRAAGVQPTIIFLQENISREQALLIEIEEISKIGRKNLGQGPLLNLTDGGDGCNNPSAGTRQKMSISQTGKKQNKDMVEKRSAKLCGKARPQHVIDALIRANSGAKRSLESCQKMSLSKIGVRLSEDHKQNISKSLLGHPVSDETKMKLSNSIKGYKHSNESRHKMSIMRMGKPSMIKNKPQEKIKCPQCGKEGGKSVMKRWHFNMCGVK